MALRKPWEVAEQLDRFVARHQELLEETSAYEAWADANHPPREAQEAKREWAEKHRRVLGEKNRLKQELDESNAAYNREQVATGRKAHPLETITDEAFPQELVMLDPKYSDPSHFSSIADKQQALIIRNANDEMAKRRSQQRRKKR